MAATKNRTSARNGTVIPGMPDAAPAPAPSDKVAIPAIQSQIVEVKIVGTTPLLVNAWSHKAKQMMLDKQMKRATRGREAKNPEEDYMASRYISTAGWDGIPVSGLKACLVNACRATDVPMTLAKRMIFVLSQGQTKDGQELVRIYGEPMMDQGMVRIDQGTADIRFRAKYVEWSAQFQIEYLASILSAEQVANLVMLAGFIEGLCEWRPGSPKNNSGSNGRFEIRNKE